ncbi:MAG: DUF2752 domain-containing protein [Acidimicrobiia bacterium]
MTAIAHHRRTLRRWGPWLGYGPMVLVGLLTLASPSDDGPTICPVALITGVACPGCGMSRAMAWLFRGEFGRSVTYHPLAPLLLILGLVGLIWAIGYRLRGWKAPQPVVITSLGIGLGVALLGVWIVRLTSGTLPPV